MLEYLKGKFKITSVNPFIFLIEDNMHISGGGLTGLESVTIFIITVFLSFFLFLVFDISEV